MTSFPQVNFFPVSDPINSDFPVFHLEQHPINHAGISEDILSMDAKRELALYTIPALVLNCFALLTFINPICHFPLVSVDASIVFLMYSSVSIAITPCAQNRGWRWSPKVLAYISSRWPRFG